MQFFIGDRSSRSIDYYLKGLLIILISIFLINLLVSFLIVTTTRQQSINYVTDTVHLYLNEAQQKLDAIDHFMIWTVKNDPLLENIEESQGMEELPESISDFRSRVIDFQHSTGSEYQFFLALKEENFFLNTSPLRMGYSEYLEAKQFFLTEIQRSATYENLYTWQSVKLNDEFYLFHSLEYNNRTLISLVAVEDILLPLRKINLGDNGLIVMKNEEVGYLSDPGNVEMLQTQKWNRLFSSYLLFEESETSLPFSLHVSVDHFSAFKKVVFAQLALILATLLISVILFIILKYIKTNVISPVQLFSKNLSAINKNNETIDFESSSIKELEQAGIQFKVLINEIKKLKVNIYEKEFEKKQIQMDFLKLQIKPHFYLNCLTTIYSMAQMEMYKEIKEMTLATSKYFRYLFQTNQNFVMLQKELDHINDYLDIQKLLHVQAFHFKSFIETGTDKAKIPPFALQTFIENTVKHSVSLDEQIDISIRIEYSHERNEWIKIEISDSGPGFSSDVLSRLQNNVPLSNKEGNHIGINNVLQRLKLLYGEEFSIEFFNGPEGGASIVLVLPYMVYEE
ncbi:sensor histidine kinase [Jeotgalibacillus sp. S-D1]|uniref:sensor histidine kinase n=1 Tax=Jeotgalibacillus sp. S-D1 TaxID=2552189 RepID=UPI0014044A59|nr:histidine kinase [Jeotgalibacillus sp. S-D1]